MLLKHISIGGKFLFNNELYRKIEIGKEKRVSDPGSTIVLYGNTNNNVEDINGNLSYINENANVILLPIN